MSLIPPLGFSVHSWVLALERVGTVRDMELWRRLSFFVLVRQPDRCDRGCISNLAARTFWWCITLIFHSPVSFSSKWWNICLSVGNDAVTEGEQSRSAPLMLWLVFYSLNLISSSFCRSILEYFLLNPCCRDATMKPDSHILQPVSRQAIPIPNLLMSLSQQNKINSV